MSGSRVARAEARVVLTLVCWLRPRTYVSFGLLSYSFFIATILQVKEQAALNGSNHSIPGVQRDPSPGGGRRAGTRGTSEEPPCHKGVPCGHRQSEDSTLMVRAYLGLQALNGFGLVN